MKMRYLVIAIVALLLLSGCSKVMINGKVVENGISIEDMKYSPAKLTISAGETVTWINNDDKQHSVTGYGYESGTMRSGNTYSHTFTEPGEYGYKCDFHPEMKGKIIVN